MEFRWEHAQARIAARRGNQAEAQKHVVAAKNFLAPGTDPEQTQFLTYLQGYVAFYAGEYKAALQELLKANQNDPFIACMIGQTYEKLGDDGKALEYYHKASTAVAHNPAAAYAVPLAKKKPLSASELAFAALTGKTADRCYNSVAVEKLAHHNFAEIASRSTNDCPPVS